MISRLSLPDAEVRTSTLGTIARVAEGLRSPAVVVIGDVVYALRLREVLAA